MKERQARTVAARAKLETAREALSKQKARKDSLEEILSHRAYTTESVKRLFTAIEHGQIADFKPVGVLADFVEVKDPTHGKKPVRNVPARRTSEFVVVKDWAEAERGVELMRAEPDGRITFLVHPEAEGKDDVVIPERSRDRRAPARHAAADQRPLPWRAADVHPAPRARASWFRITRPRNPCRCGIPKATSCCRTASAITDSL